MSKMLKIAEGSTLWEHTDLDAKFGRTRVKIHKYHLKQGQYARYRMTSKPVFVIPRAGNPIDILIEGRDVLVPTFDCLVDEFSKEIDRLIAFCGKCQLKLYPAFKTPHVHIPIRAMYYREGKLFGVEAGLFVANTPYKFGP